ncbi:extracellular solute-binding protein [Streptomyces sanyensis]|uniref:extracellular solute-binding protein n=1 Tax=Streptomyces sanyensis TaxID=568869 RepID=UPI003D76C64D
MNLIARIAAPGAALAPAAALAVAGLAATACAPATSSGASQEDGRTGTLRVWLFREVGNAPKEKAVDAAVAGFLKAHEGVDVRVEYIPVETRAERIKAAFNDPRSASGVIEYGNTDTAGYVEDGGLADVTAEFGAWDEAADTDPTARHSVTVGGRVHGVPLFVGARALYHRADVFADLGIETLGSGSRFVPATPAWGRIDASRVLPTMFQEVVSGRKDVRTAASDAARTMDAAFAAAG